MTDRIITFIYDGECPLCSRAALAYRIRRTHGDLQLVDARQDPTHPLLARIDALGLDLDEGMVIFDGAEFHHGREALRIMARYADDGDLYNRVVGSLFRKQSVARAAYPPLRWLRNRLLACRNVGPIGNIEHRSEPLFRPVFGDSWAALPPVLRRRYANRPHSLDRVRIEGRLDLVCAAPLRWFAPLVGLLAGLPPITENAVPVTVELASDPDGDALTFDRLFHLRGRPPFRFRSRVMPRGSAEVVEVMPSRLGVRMRIAWNGAAVEMTHAGYLLRLGRLDLPVPLGPLLGRGHAREIAIDDKRYELQFEIVHPWWGKVYGYQGRLAVRAD